MKKIIAVSAGLMPPDTKRAVYKKKQLCYIENDLAKWLASYSVLPVLVPDLGNNELRNLLAKTDGLLLQGGTDIAPENYGEQAIDPQKWPGDILRDRYELNLIKIAVELQLPILGICRGAQLLNVYFGGTLYQDLPSQLGNGVCHRDPDSYDKNTHEIKFIAPPFSTNIEEVEVNSIHHQGIKKLGKGLKAFAFSSEDQLVEAFYSTSIPNILAVQWHPEFHYNLGLGDVDEGIMNLFLSAYK